MDSGQPCSCNCDYEGYSTWSPNYDEDISTFESVIKERINLGIE